MQTFTIRMATIEETDAELCLNSCEVPDPGILPNSDQAKDHITSSSQAGEDGCTVYSSPPSTQSLSPSNRATSAQVESLFDQDSYGTSTLLLKRPASAFVVSSLKLTTAASPPSSSLGDLAVLPSPLAHHNAHHGTKTGKKQGGNRRLLVRSSSASHLPAGMPEWGNEENCDSSSRSMWPASSAVAGAATSETASERAALLAALQDSSPYSSSQVENMRVAIQKAKAVSAAALAGLHSGTLLVDTSSGGETRDSASARNSSLCSGSG
jgi:hypothetical protein